MENLIMKFSVNVKHVLLLHIESLLRLAFNIVVKKVLVMSLIDQPNAEGKTLLHITTSEDFDVATELVLDHGTNPNVQDANGNSPLALHKICRQRDIQMATCVLKKNGQLLKNEDLRAPEILRKLFFDQREEDVQELMKSKRRTGILDKNLKKEHTLFKLVEKDKQVILILDKKNNPDRKNYVKL